MNDDRLAPLTDGVVAVIITIMVLEIKPPPDATVEALARLWPTFAAYLVSFFYIAIYWNRHRTLFGLLTKVDGAVFWANINLLFWLSFLPFTTAWAGEHSTRSLPALAYGIVLCIIALSWNILQSFIERRLPSDGRRREAAKPWRGSIVILFYLCGIGLSLPTPRCAYVVYAIVQHDYNHMRPHSGIGGLTPADAARCVAQPSPPGHPGNPGLYL